MLGHVGEKEPFESKVVLGRELGVVVPVGDGVNPREENNGPGNQLVECNVLIKLDDAVEFRLPQERNKIATDSLCKLVHGRF